MSFEKNLIKEVKKREILYNKNYGGYKNSARKAEDWEEIATILGISGK